MENLRIQSEPFDQKTEPLSFDDILLEERSDIDKLNEIINKCLEGFNVYPLVTDQDGLTIQQKINTFLLEVTALQGACEREVTQMYNKGLLFSSSSGPTTTETQGNDTDKIDINFIINLSNSFIVQKLIEMNLECMNLFRSIVAGELCSIQADVEIALEKFEIEMQAKKLKDTESIQKYVSNFANMMLKSNISLLRLKTNQHILNDYADLLPEFLLLDSIQKLELTIQEKSEEIIERLSLVQLDITLKEQIQQLKLDWSLAYTKMRQESEYIFGHKKYQEYLIIYLQLLAMTNFPCSLEKFDILKEMIRTAILKVPNKIKEQLTIQMNNSLDQYSQQNYEQIKVQKKQIKEEALSKIGVNDFQLISVWIFLTTTSSINQHGMIQINIVEASRRSMLLRFFKQLIGSKNAQCVLSYLEQQVISEQQTLIKDLNYNESWDYYSSCKDKESDISTFLFQCTNNRDTYIGKQLQHLDQIYQGDEKKINKQLEIINNALKEAEVILTSYGVANQAKLPLCLLENINANKDMKHKHVKITFSGFLSQDSCHDKDWLALTTYYQDYDIGSYNLQWNSIKSQSLFMGILISLKYVGVDLLTSLIGVGKIKMAIRIAKSLLAAKMTSNAFEAIHKCFQSAKENAKLAGKLVACALALRYPFMNQSISLVGFSLGCQVIKSCLKTLHKLGANDIIQDVTFMGGAANISSMGETKKMKRVFTQTVNGRIKNVYTTRDIILLLYSLTNAKSAIGRNPIYKEDSDNSKYKIACMKENAVVTRQNVFRLQNYDISKLMKFADCTTFGHLFYRKKMNEILMHIKYEA